MAILLKALSGLMALATLGWLGAKFGAPDTLQGPVGEWYVFGTLAVLTVVIGFAALKSGGEAEAGTEPDRPDEPLPADSTSFDASSTPVAGDDGSDESEAESSDASVAEGGDASEEEGGDASEAQHGDEQPDLPADDASEDEDIIDPEPPVEAAEEEAFDPAPEGDEDETEATDDDTISGEASQEQDDEEGELPDGELTAPEPIAAAPADTGSAEEDPDRTMDIQSALMSGSSEDIKSLSQTLPPDTLKRLGLDEQSKDEGSVKKKSKGKGSLQARLQKLKKNLGSGPAPSEADAAPKSKLRAKGKFDSPTKQVQKDSVKLSATGGKPPIATSSDDVEQTQVHKIGRDLLNRARAAYEEGGDSGGRPKHNLPSNPYTEGVGETSAEEMNELWKKFVDSSAQLGRDLNKLDPDKFLDQIRRNYTAICARFNCTRVTFTVRIKDGRVALKATPDIR